MVAIRLLGFGGMIPALDDRLLPDIHAAYAENLRLYAGTLIGLPVPINVHTLVSPTAAKVYRLPNSYGQAQTIDNSVWMEFENKFTDVIRAPIVGDVYDRYYWMNSSAPPAYNTRARIEYSHNVRSATVTFTNSTDVVNWTDHGLSAGDYVSFTSTGTLPAELTASTVYYITTGSVTASTFKISSTPSLAAAGTAIDFTDDGTGVHTGMTATMGEWLLGIPGPGSISVVPSGGTGPTVTRSYVVTFVSEYGEEGPPSAPATNTGNQDGTWTVTLPSPAANDLGIVRNLKFMRVYRTITSASGVATYFFVAEVAITATSYPDTAADSTVSANNQLPSTTWTAPPTDLLGMVLLPNGIIAAWREQEIWFSEPYRPHAWPAEYVLAVEYPIVGMGVIAQTLVCCTAGFPVTASGVHPSTITTSTLANYEPCVSRGSILATPEGVYYASQNGIVKVVPGQATNITRNLIVKDEWQALIKISTLSMARLGTALYLFGSASTGVFNAEAFQTDAFVQEDLTAGFNGIMFDLASERVALEVLTTTELTSNVFNDPWSGEVFIIRGGEVRWIDLTDLAPTIEPYIWRSKIFQLQSKKNLGAMKIYFEVPPNSPTLNPVPNTNLVQTLAADQYGLVRVYADGQLLHTRELRTSGELWRLPSGAKYDFYQFEVNGRVRVQSVQVASTPKELKVV